MREKQLSSGFLIRSGGKFLLARSYAGPKATPASDKWTIPKGHVEPGESTIEAAYRETLEETGWDLKHLSYGNVWNHFSHIYSMRNKDVIGFFCDDESGMLQDEVLKCSSFVDDDPNYPEIDAYKWVDIKEARLLVARSQQELFSKKMPWNRE